MLNELSDQAAIQTMTYQRKITKYYNSKMKERTFKNGHLVLREIMANTKDHADGPLGPNWEGPLVIHKVVSPRTYRLSKPDGNVIRRT